MIHRIRKDLLGPQASQVHVNAPLTTYSEAYFLGPDIEVSSTLGICPVSKQTDSYWIWNQGDMLAAKSSKRAIGAEARAIGVGLTTGSYTTDVYGVLQTIEDETMANADMGVNLERVKTQTISDAMLRAEEEEFLAAALVTSTWTGSTTAGDITPSTLWDVAGSTPIKDVAAQYESILKQTQKRPNVAIMGRPVFRALINNADILNRLGLGGNPTEARKVTKAALASLLEVDKIVVSEVSYNSADAGATASYSFFAGKHLLLAHVPENNALETPSAFKRFMWMLSGSPAAQGRGVNGRRIIRYRKEPRTTVIEGEHAFATKITAPLLGAFFASVVS